MNREYPIVIPAEKVFKSNLSAISRGQLCVGAEIKFFNHKSKFYGSRQFIHFRQKRPRCYIFDGCDYCYYRKDHPPICSGLVVRHPPNSIILNPEGGAFQIIWKIKANFSYKGIKMIGEPTYSVNEHRVIIVTWTYGKSKYGRSRPNFISPARLYDYQDQDKNGEFDGIVLKPKTQNEALINNHLFSSTLTVNVTKSLVVNQTEGIGLYGLGFGKEKQTETKEHWKALFSINTYFNL